MTTTLAPAPLAHLLAALRSPLTDSRELAAASGVLYPLLTLLVRLPQTMVPLGVLTTVGLAVASPALSALCAGAVTLGSALRGLAMGAASSWRHRQLGLVLLGLLNPLAVWWLLRLLAEAAPGDTPARLVPSCLLAGLVLPQMGVACRLRWHTLLTANGRAELYDTALRHESVMDALATVLAAAVTGLVAVTLGPRAVLVLAAALTVATTAVFLLHRSGRLPPTLVHFLPPSPARPRTGAARHRQRRVRELRLLPVVGMTALGGLVGSMLGSVVVFASSVDAFVSVSWLYAVAGLTSAGAAVLASSRTGTTGLWNRWVAVAAASVLAAMLLSLPDGSVGMVVVLALAGPTIGPSLVAVYEVAALVTPSSRVTALTTVMTAAMSTGLTLGLVLSGWSGEAWGYHTAALFPVLSAAVVLAAALRFVHRWQRTPRVSA